jgi:hypothetical protein
MTELAHTEPEAVLSEVLAWLEENLDPVHVDAAHARQQRALRRDPIARPPVTIAAPPFGRFPYYPYSEAFRDPLKMLVNELVDASAGLAPMPSVVNSVLLRDDFPLQIRANYGVGLLASLFGADVHQVEDNFPWTTPLGRQRVVELLDRGLPDLTDGLYPRVLETMAIYREALAPYPGCQAAIRITQPDLQGPFDVATQLWGGEIFTAFYEHPDLLRDVLDWMAETYVMVCRAITPHTTQQGRQGFIHLHWSLCQGGCLIKDDSATLVSPHLYKAFIQPANAKVLTALGGGGIHWCGSGDQWREVFVRTEGLTSVDIAQPHMIDLPAWAHSLEAHGLAVSRMNFMGEAFFEHGALELFPTGTAFVVTVNSLDEGRRTLDRVRSMSRQ